MKYEITVTVSREKFKDKAYKRTLNLNYNDDTFRECEDIIRDTLKDVANDFIDEAFYG